jgi:hypothetical protein
MQLTLALILVNSGGGKQLALVLNGHGGKQPALVLSGGELH